MKGLATQRGRPPAEIRPYLGQVAVTTARAYEIHAVALFEGILFVQVIDDRGMPTWWPAWLLDLTDRSLPPDWICNLFPDQPAMVLGPEFVARDQGSYAGMVELDAELADIRDRALRELALIETADR